MRTAWLAAFWVPYLLVPLGFGLLEMPSILFWEEAVLHALMVFGYGLIGCLFYAATGQKEDRLTGAKITAGDRLLQATGINVGLALMTLLVAYSAMP